ncbi:MAG: hypothetical protein ACH349_06160 [Candidatus Rhabdochlamydia sp.]
MKNKYLTASVILLCLPLTGCWTVEEGQQTGQIVNIWKSGRFIKTWECKLIRGGLDDGSGVLGQSVQLTIEDEDQLNKAREFMIKKKNVVISWHKEEFNFFRSDSNSLFIDSIETTRE